MTYTQALAQEIRAELGRRNMSRNEFIRRVRASYPDGKSEAQLHRMLRGEYPWDINTLEAASQALNLSLVDLIRRAETVYRCSLPSLSATVNAQVSGLLVSA